MSDIKGTTRAQTLFLRKARNNPHGPAPDSWPSPIVLRRWLRRPAFCAALETIRNAHRFRADLHLASASSSAAQSIESAALDPIPVDPNPIANRKLQIANACSLLRLDYLRQRFSPFVPPSRPRKAKSPINITILTLEDALKLIGRADPQRPVGEVCDFWLSQIAEFKKEQPDAKPPALPPSPSLLTLRCQRSG